MADQDIYRVVAEHELKDGRVQLIEDQNGGYRLRKVSADRGKTMVSAPIHSDRELLAEAREYFSDFVPLGGVPVDAT